MESELLLSIGGLPPLSARGCKQVLSPISVGQFQRTVNGDLVYTGPQAIKKYHSIISCEDKAPLATDGLHRGTQIQVSCIQQLWQKISDDTTNITLDKMPIPSSVVVYGKNHKPLEHTLDGQTITVVSFEEATYVCYRPILEMRVISYQLSTNEWGVKVGWSLELEEI